LLEGLVHHNEVSPNSQLSKLPLSVQAYL